MPTNNSTSRKGPLNVVYFGSPDFSAGLLRSLFDNEERLGMKVTLVFTQPDRPAGRKLVLRPTPVKQLAVERLVPVFDLPFRANREKAIHLLRESDIDLAILYAFNEIIPKQILTIPHHGFWNIHPSLLPKYRGPSPLVYPIILGDQKTGVSLMQMDAKMDTGDIIGQISFAIENTDTHQSLVAKATDHGFALITQYLQKIDVMRCVKQDDSQATYTRKLTREDGFIPLASLQTLMSGHTVALGVFRLMYEYHSRYTSHTPPQYGAMSELYRLWRGLHPWPGVWTLMPTKDGEKRLKILAMQVVDEVPAITQVQVEGKDAVSLKEFQTSYPGLL